MRVTSLLLALLIAGGLFYWFHARHQTGDIAAAAATSDPTSTVAEDATGQLQSSQNILAPANPAADAIPVLVLDSQARPTESTLVVRGRTEAVRNVQVSAQTSGSVISQPLRRGSRVAAGQVLCQLDPGIRAAELAEAEASLHEAQAEAEASTRLSQKGFAAEMTLKTRQARLEAAQARLDRVRWDIAQLDVVAPFDGILETDSAEIGSYLTPGVMCANVIDLSRVKVSGFVAEQEIDQLHVGQTATARLINGYETQGEISFLSRMADEQTRTYAVEVTLDNADGRIRDGMTAELQVTLPEQTGHLIPQSALTLDDAGRLGVRLDQDGIARFQPVRILSEVPGRVWVAGPPETARIVIVGQEFVRDGRRVAGTSVDPSQLQ
ncbi:MAG: efflux RND transporter periplasmic adaptor subunit [Paracoccaceae bacterium]